jgi:UDP-glucose 4-epimerase
MRYLVTGGCGFIGSNLVDYLLEQGNKVIVIDNESSETNHKNPNAKYYKYCITDVKNTNKLYKKVDCVFHLAAKARIQKCILDPVNTFKTNYMGTLSVLECCKNNNVRRMVFSSTSSIYGNNKAPQKEKDKPDCMNCYSASKLDAENLCKLYNKLYELDVAILRYFNVYGKRESKNGPYASVLGIFYRLLCNNKPLTIVGDGSQKRDFTSVKDVVIANNLICNYKNKINAEIFNVGSGQNYSIIEIANSISDKIIFLPTRQGESEKTLADISKIKKIGYEPKEKILDYCNYINKKAKNGRNNKSNKRNKR